MTAEPRNRLAIVAAILLFSAPCLALEHGDPVYIEPAQGSRSIWRRP
jgi:hypothetical protein